MFLICFQILSTHIKCSSNEYCFPSRTLPAGFAWAAEYSKSSYYALSVAAKTFIYQTNFVKLHSQGLAMFIIH